MGDAGLHRLKVRRIIDAPIERVFSAWTEPRHLLVWWGPGQVRCLDAAVDLRVGGEYRIVNGMPDGTRLTISGRFETVTPPTTLVYSWKGSPDSPAPERVTVTFAARGGGTEVIVLHELIRGKTTRDGHRDGWVGCLEGLEKYLATSE